MNITKKELKKELGGHIKQIAKVNNLEPKIDKRINELYAYFKIRIEKGLIKEVNLDYLKLNKLAAEGFKNHSYNIQKGDVIKFNDKNIKGYWQVIELSKKYVTFGKLTKEGNISKRTNHKTFDRQQIENIVRNCSELKDINKAKEVN